LGPWSSAAIESLRRSELRFCLDLLLNELVHTASIPPR
jgi:hypothetical protein